MIPSASHTPWYTRICICFLCVCVSTYVYTSTGCMIYIAWGKKNLIKYTLAQRDYRYNRICVILGMYNIGTLEIDQRRRLSGQTGQPGPHSSSTHSHKRAHTVCHFFSHPPPAPQTGGELLASYCTLALALEPTRAFVCIRAYIILCIMCNMNYVYVNINI